MDGRHMQLALVPRGHKRHSEDNFENEQRLAKRFNSLKIESNGQLYNPAIKAGPKVASTSTDSMQVDDSKDKLYVYNIDDELTGAESEEERLIFLPDIEKRLTKIPKSILTNNERPATSGEIVLYNVPQSLSIPQEQDNVRKAIIETRARARDMQLKAAKDLEISEGTSSGHEAVPYIYGDRPASPARVEEDEDAMDLG